MAFVVDLIKSRQACLPTMEWMTAGHMIPPGILPQTSDLEINNKGEIKTNSQRLGLRN